MLLNEMRGLVAKALEYNIAEEAMDYYNNNSAEVELYDLAGDIAREAADFKEGYIFEKLRSCESAGEALGLPDGIAKAIKRCYMELSYHEAEAAVYGAVQVLKGHALIDIL